jgi:hypothetical protein
MRCDECRYVKRCVSNPSLGECRRFPPSCCEKMPPDRFPAVLLADDFCGEFQPKPDPDEKLR